MNVGDMSMFYSCLLYFLLSAALESLDPLLSYPATTLESHASIILITTLILKSIK